MLWQYSDVRWFLSLAGFGAGVVPWDQHAGLAFDFEVTKRLVAEDILQRLASGSADTKTFEMLSSIVF